MIFIIIPVFNRVDFTIACLQSLSEQQFRDFQTIVVDDGSSDGTEAAIGLRFPQTIVLRGDGNLWWAGATNMGVRKALALSVSEHDHILTLNNDLVVPSDYLEQLTQASSRYPATLIGSVSVNIDSPDQLHFAGTRWNPVTAAYRPAVSNSNAKEIITQDRLLPSDLLPGRGVLIPIGVFEKIGLYQDKVFRHYMADEDFSRRAMAAGYHLGVYSKAIVYNRVNETGLSRSKRNLTFYKNVFTSKKSPSNILYRWRWAHRHAKIPAALYFTIDMLRTIKGVLTK